MSSSGSGFDRGATNESVSGGQVEGGASATIRFDLADLPEGNALRTSSPRVFGSSSIRIEKPRASTRKRNSRRTAISGLTRSGTGSC